MNVLIAEDEPLAAERLTDLLQECDPTIKVAEQVDSVKDLARFFESGKTADLLLLDIQLADGKSFEAFNKANVTAPIIFTTAYDQYAIQAFKHFSIDYLLKPIRKNELEGALKKFNQIRQPFGNEQLSRLKQLLDQQSARKYKERFLIKSGNKLQYKATEEAAYFFAEGKLCYLVTKKENKKFLIDHTLEELETTLDLKTFFRISRKFVVHIDAIHEIKGSVSARMEVRLSQPCEHELVVSRDRIQAFKTWLDR
jgi:DNA-binding LytR/AlgR family response regulator